MRLKFVPMAVREDHGYGVVGARLAHYLGEEGADILGRTDGGWDLRVLVGTVDSWFLDHQQPDLVFHTMWEADPMPANWLPWINHAGALWVPSQWIKSLFIRGGVTRPIFVSGYGVDETEFAYIERDRGPDQPFVFLGWGRALVDRKRSTDIVKAYCMAGLDQEDGCRLVLKHNENVLGDERAELPFRTAKFRGVDITEVRGTYNGRKIRGATMLTGSMSRFDLGRLFYHVDCLVYPSANEGFGLMPLEAMATGLPVLAPAHSGLAEYVRDDIAITLPVREGLRDPFLERVWGTECSSAVVAVGDIADRMRWVYEHRDQARRLGQSAAVEVAARWTWRGAARRALSALEDYSLRRGQYQYNRAWN